MEDKELVHVVINVLTTLITGGFIIVLLDISNRKNRVRDDFKSINSKFVDNLTAYCRFVVWYEPVLHYIDGADEYVKKFKESVRFVKLKGEKVITNHTSLVSNDRFEELKLLFCHINNIWDEYEKMTLAYMAMNLTELEKNRRFIEKELSKLAPDYLLHIGEHSLLADVSGDFHDDICKPFLNKYEEQRILESLYKYQARIVFGMILLVVVAIILLVCFSICWLPYCALWGVLLLFLVSLLLLYVDEHKQLKFFAKFKRKNKKE